MIRRYRRPLLEEEELNQPNTDADKTAKVLSSAAGAAETALKAGQAYSKLQDSKLTDSRLFSSPKLTFINKNATPDPSTGTFPMDDIWLKDQSGFMAGMYKPAHEKAKLNPDFVSGFKDEEDALRHLGQKKLMPWEDVHRYGGMKPRYQFEGKQRINPPSMLVRNPGLNKTFTGAGPKNIPQVPLNVQGINAGSGVGVRPSYPSDGSRGIGVSTPDLLNLKTKYPELQNVPRDVYNMPEGYEYHMMTDADIKKQPVEFALDELAKVSGGGTIPTPKAVSEIDAHIYKSLQEKGIIKPGDSFEKSMELVKQHKPHMFPGGKFTEVVDNQPILMPDTDIGEPIIEKTEFGIPNKIKRGMYEEEYLDDGITEEMEQMKKDRYIKNKPLPPMDPNAVEDEGGFVSKIGQGGDQFMGKFGTGEGMIARETKNKIKDVKDKYNKIKDFKFSEIGKGGAGFGGKFGTGTGKIAQTAKNIANIGKGGLKAMLGGGGGALAAMGPAGWAMMALSLFGDKLFPKHTLLGKLFSDKRLKKNIKYVGKSKSGIPIVDFEYKDEMNIPGRYRGVLSQDVPWAAEKHPQYGYEMVDYNKIDVPIKRIR
mgnify:CR=1 FL=1|tara:strand:- start:1219 stop:3000 length:1782 start_codon:yes stop_codon:yes gene_type:complete